MSLISDALSPQVIFTWFYNYRVKTILQSPYMDFSVICVRHSALLNVTLFIHIFI